MPAMLVVLRYVELLALALWVGGMVFFVAIASPAIFRTLGLEAGGKLIRLVFNKYYRLGYACGAAGAGAGWALCVVAGAPRFGPLVPALVSGMIGIFLYMGLILRPQILKVREALGPLDGLPADHAGKGLFQRMHRRSVLLNAAVLAAGLAALFLIAQR